MTGEHLQAGGSHRAAPDRLSSRRRPVDGFAGAQELFQEHGWSDGLPVVPPTPELVEHFLSSTGLDPTQTVLVIPEQARRVTVEKVAVNAVAAGCRPEYLPVVVAALRAMSADQFNLHSTTVSGATAPLVMLSGPVVQLLGVNTGFGVLGSGAIANATIGRAVRLVLQNLCGGIPGVIDKATMGHPGKYSYCIGEATDNNPWGPRHTDEGIPAELSAVTVFSGEAPINARNDWSSRPADILATIADAMKVSHFTGGSFVVIVGPQHAACLAAAGLDRAAVRHELFRLSKRSVADLKRAGRVPGPIAAGDVELYRAAAPGPDDILVVVAGGHLYGYSAVIPPWVGGHESKPVTTALAEDELLACQSCLDGACPIN